jgi:hypothetical protein
MKRLLASLVCVVCLIAAPVLNGAPAEKQPLVIVRGPTVVAFFAPVSDADLEKDPYLGDALSNFQSCALAVGKPLKQSGIEFHELYARSFAVHLGSGTSTFRPAKLDVGYYFVRPGKAPHVVYGVKTEDEVMHIAKTYFGEPR